MAPDRWLIDADGALREEGSLQQMRGVRWVSSVRLGDVPLVAFAPAAWRPVPAARVAGALVAAAKQELPGVRVLENRAILATAR